MNQIRLIVDDMNSVLEKYPNLDFQFKFFENVKIFGNTVLIDSNSNVHAYIEDYIYPQIQEKIVYHYTTIEAKENIIKSNTFRLYNILKRYGEGELKPFLKKFDFDEAFDDTDNLKYLNDYKNIFYASFVEVPISGIDTQEMKHFEQVSDCKLKFKITSNKGYFRKINYHNDMAYKLLADLTRISSKYDKKFLIVGMSSRFSSFCIDQLYEIENEYRIYWRHWNEEDGFLIRTDEDENKYIEIKLGENNFSGIKIELIP